MKRLNNMKNFLLFIYQLPQNLLGLLLIKLYRAKEFEFQGLRYYFSESIPGSISLGKYSILSNHNIITIKHEAIGHATQSRRWSWLYLIEIGLPSITRNIYSRVFNKSAQWYYGGFPEKQADRLAGIVREWHN